MSLAVESLAQSNNQDIPIWLLLLPAHAQRRRRGGKGASEIRATPSIVDRPAGRARFMGAPSGTWQAVASSGQLGSREPDRVTRSAELIPKLINSWRTLSLYPCCATRALIHSLWSGNRYRSQVVTIRRAGRMKLAEFIIRQWIRIEASISQLLSTRLEDHAEASLLASAPSRGEPWRLVGRSGPRCPAGPGQAGGLRPTGFASSSMQEHVLEPKRQRELA